MVLNVDLDAPVPPSDTSNEVGTSSYVPAVAFLVQDNQQRSMPQVVPIDVDSFDDDVILSSPRSFAQAKNNSAKNRSRSNVIDVDSESTGRNASSNHSKRRRITANQPIINCESYVVSSVSNSLRASGKGFSGKTSNISSQPPPPPPEPTFNCSVCLGPLIEATTTKCGHIFCKVCIKKSIATQKKCPTCRRKTTLKDIFKVYLPATT